MRRQLTAAFLVATVVWAVAAYGSEQDVLHGVDSFSQDLLQPGVATAPEVVMVGIDRETLLSTGSWPWPRARHAELLDVIGSGDPRMIVYDLLFADPAAGDGVLADALRRSPTVLAAALILDLSRRPPSAVDAVEPTEALASAAVAVGHANVAPTVHHGVVRSIPLYASGEREVPVPALALVAVAGGAVPLIEREDGVQVGDRLIPLEDAMLRINFSAGLDRNAVIPAIEVLDGAVDPAEFEDRIVVVGATEPTLGDLYSVPGDRTGSTPGVSIHANAINTILSRAYLSPVGRTPELVLIAALCLMTAGVVTTRRLLVAAVVAASAIVGVLLFTTWRFYADGELWPITWPVLAIAGVFASGTGWRYVTEIRHRRRATALFAQYVPDDVMGELADPELLERSIEGRRVEVSVVFCDLRGFTPIAAALSPVQVHELLDLYYDYAVAIVHRQGGTVMQFVGDEVFAIFGAPLDHPDRTSAALRTATDLVDEIDRLHAALAERGLPPIRFGIGVHEGEVVAAHVGTRGRRQYAVLGDPVNVGSRICSRAEADQVVTTAEMAARADVPAVSIGAVPLKGVADSVELCLVRSSTVVL